MHTNCRSELLTLTAESEDYLGTVIEAFCWAASIRAVASEYDSEEANKRADEIEITEADFEAARASIRSTFS